MVPDWNELAEKEVKVEKERLARNEKSNLVLATLIVVFTLVIFLVIGGVRWFLGSPPSIKEMGWSLGIAIAMWLTFVEVQNFGDRHDARELRQIRIEKKLDMILSKQDKQ